ncbi:MAG: hypothetical protein PQJ46_15460, partial [Spirochaetales bacterium]|nr:hypothetical protein [Spirochaetales bacterium]
LLDAFKKGNNRAGIELSLYYKRLKKWNDAVSIWLKIWEKNKSIFCGIELAKYYEHKKKDYESALQITETILSMQHFKITNYIVDLEKRRNRINNKITGRNKC